MNKVSEIFKGILKDEADIDVDKDALAMMPEGTNTEHMTFLMLTVHAAVGGKPAIGYNKGMGWVMIPTCECQGCKQYQHVVKIEGKPEMLDACIDYVAGMKHLAEVLTVGASAGNAVKH